jgi:hypothetical protein
MGNTRFENHKMKRELLTWILASMMVFCSPSCRGGTQEAVNNIFPDSLGHPGIRER